MTHLLHDARRVNGEFDSPDRFKRHLDDVRDLLRDSASYFLGKPEFKVRQFAEHDELLVLENENGSIDGCIAFEFRDLHCGGDGAGEWVQRRACLLRLLAVRKVPFRREFANLLAHEAMLRATVRSCHDDEDKPEIVGTSGIIIDSNDRGLRWAEKLAPRVTIVPGEQTDRRDPVLLALRCSAEKVREQNGGNEPYRFVFAKRPALVDAARLHQRGLKGFPIGEGGPDIVYDGTDPYEREIDVAAANLANRLPSTLVRLAIVGNQEATAWGAPYAPRMGINLGGTHYGQT